MSNEDLWKMRIDILDPMTSVGGRIGRKSLAGVTNIISYPDLYVVDRRSCFFLPIIPSYWLTYGKSRPGDGLSFPQNPRSDELLARLAKKLISIDSHV